MSTINTVVRFTVFFANLLFGWFVILPLSLFASLMHSVVDREWREVCAAAQTKTLQEKIAIMNELYRQKDPVLYYLTFVSGKLNEWSKG